MDVFSYEIRTFERRWHSSLIMLVQCPNDLAAIMVARDFTPRGQAVEVWRDDRLIYHTGLRPVRVEDIPPKPKPAPFNRVRFSNFLSRNR
ncbi:MAG TPA: hypothetical protein VFI23_14210 [Rhizomicrobium sp.]|nr:hypothetical protein [Rhizomicrobium sp.]